MTVFSIHARALTLWERRGRRVAAWIAAAVLTACSGKATEVVTTANVGSVSITPASTTVSVGAQVPLQALVQDSSGGAITGTNIFWSVQSSSIAMVSSAGVVTGVALGSTQVAASVNGKSGIATITVVKTPVASVVVTPPRVDAAPGVQVQLSATAYDAAQNPLSGGAIAWSTSNPAVATVNSSGVATGVTPGTVTITASSEGKSGTATLTISVPVASVTVAPSVDSVTTTGSTSSKTIVATVTDANGTVVTDRIVNWTSTPGGVATVSPSSGALTTVTGMNVGQAQVVATSGTKTATASIKVMLEVKSVMISAPPMLKLSKTPTAQLTATPKNGGTTITGRTIAWSSDNTSVATVDATGKVTAKAVGTAGITATVAFDGVASAKAMITVKP